MIAVLAYWLLLLVIFLPGGLLLNKIFRLHTKNIPLLILLGMFFYSVAFTATAFFTPLNVTVFLCCLTSSLLFACFLCKDLVSALRSFRVNLISLTFLQRAVLAALTIAAALKSAQLPTIVDNESYYVQTIKWLNEYGFVKGLGNLHPFLAQMSAWQVLQAGINLNFITNKINDLNGFLFVVCTFFCLTESNNNKNGINLIGTLPVFSGLFFFFIDSPSPDLPLIMLTPIMLYLLLKHHILIPWLLFLFMAFIKVTIAPLGLLFLYPLFRNRKNIPVMVISGALVALLWVGKNIIASGYPLYPLTIVPADVNWVVPEHLLRGLHASSNKYIYGITAEASLGEKFIVWLTKGGVDGLCNVVTVIMFLLVPLFRRIRKDRRYMVIYFTCLLHFTIIFIVSPQFRFLLPVVLSFACFVFYEIMLIFSHSRKIYYTALIVGVLTLAFTLKNFTATQLYRPEKNSAYADVNYLKKMTGNLTYYSPASNFFFYGTADAPLPCVNELQLKWFEKKYHVLPQLRGKTLDEGFYSTPVAE
jgi:hypothetical protein